MGFRTNWALLFLLCGYTAAQDMPEVRFRTTTNLVQVDALVSAPAGQPVPDLKADDFELLEDGKAQRITTYSATERRTIVFLVDLCSTFRERQEGNEGVEDRFLDWVISNGIRPGDRIAILSGSQGMAANHPLTSEPRLLRSQIDDIRVPGYLMNWCSGGPPLPVPILTAPHRDHSLDDRLTVIKAGGWETASFQALSFAIDYLKDEPGHKDLVYMGTVMFEGTGGKSAAAEVTDRANRAGITLHVLHPGAGASPPPTRPISPSDRYLPSELSEAEQKNLAAYHREQFQESTLTRVAQDTGGIFLECPPLDIYSLRLGHYTSGRILYSCEAKPLENTGGLLRFLQHSWQAIYGESGLYTLGYRPETLADGYHKLSVRVRRPGLTVHARKGYYDSAPPAPAAPVQEPLDALLDTPIHGASIRLAAVPFDAAEQVAANGFRTVVRLVVSIDPRDLSWRDQEGRKTAAVQIAAVAHGAEHQVAGSGERDCALVRPEKPEAPAQCKVDLPFGSPGIYMLRVAVRDRATGKTGTAYALAPVSEHNAGRLSLSDAVLRAAGGGGAPMADSVFAPGEEIEYRLEGYGMRIDKKNPRPKLTFRLGLKSLTEGRVVFVGPETSVNTEEASWRTTLSGKLALPNNLAPGDYLIEFVVSDKLSKVEQLRFVEFQIAKADSGSSQHGLRM